jgi:hypothetical protein
MTLLRETPGRFPEERWWAIAGSSGNCRRLALHTWEIHSHHAVIRGGYPGALVNCLGVSFIPILLGSFVFPFPAQNPPVLLVSIDGLRPDYILEAEGRDLFAVHSR